jgi:predicted RNA binding protein YcfA (HicA-like mRNA interferase family)
MRKTFPSYNEGRGLIWGYRSPRMQTQELIRMLEGDGWKLVRVLGSHHHFKHPLKPGMVTVPHPDRHLRSIERQANLKLL